MEKVVLITGASTGIGNQTVKLFQSKNWKVAATMRTPEKAEDLQNIVDVECLQLDVTDVDSIKNAIKETIDKFGRIDAVVNECMPRDPALLSRAETRCYCERRFDGRPDDVPAIQSLSRDEMGRRRL